MSRKTIISNHPYRIAKTAALLSLSFIGTVLFFVLIFQATVAGATEAVDQSETVSLWARLTAGFGEQEEMQAVGTAPEIIPASDLDLVAALNPDGDLRIDIKAAYNLVVDSNVKTPATYAPEAFYITADVCNDGSNPMTDVTAYVGDYDEIGSNHTPGIYPARQSGDGANADDPVDTGRTFDVAHPHLAGTPGTYSFTHIGSTTDAIRYIGDLAAGECKTQYWLVTYPKRGNDTVTGDNLGDAVWGASRLPEDDLWLSYDVWATGTDGGSQLEADDTRAATLRNEISAMANKIWPNGDNKVPNEYKAAIDAVLGWDVDLESGGTSAYPGETVTTEGIWYDLGNVNQGFDNDGDFVPDYNAWMQPVGDPTLFNTGCFRLVRTYGLVIVKLNDGTEYLIPFVDELYFENLPSNNTGAVGLVFYEYLALDGACSASLSPYQEVASGSDNEKFNGDYGTSIPPLIALDPAIELTKEVDTDISPSLPDTLAYTIAFTNSSPITVGNSTYGMPVIIQESIPVSTTYVTGSADDAVLINGGAITTTILYSTDDGGSWSTTEPGSGVTDIQWWLHEDLPAGASGSIGFQVTVPAAYDASFVTNVAGLSLGVGDPIVTDTATTLMPGLNSIGDTVWSDDGSGGGENGDGVQNGTESGISDMTVSLYFDFDGDGQIDPGIDTLIMTTTTSVTGGYLFDNLPDGNYIVAVDTIDPDLPTGYLASTDTSFAVDLDAAGASGTAVDYLDVDFGFAPILALDKMLNNGSPIYEGETISYTITISNLFYNTAKPALESEYYATASQPGTLFSGTAGNLTGAPDGNTYGSTTPSPNPSVTEAEAAVGTGFSISSCSTISKVEAVFYLEFSGFVNDNIEFQVFNSAGTSIWTSGLLDVVSTYGASTSGIQPFVFDISAGTGLTDWGSWDNSPANEVKLAVGAQKDASTDAFTLNVDAFGVRITAADDSCATIPSTYDPDSSINPLPLSDIYDPTQLAFISASVMPDSITPAGTLSWDNLGPLNVGESTSVDLYFKALEPFNNTAESITNTAIITTATLGNGTPTNDATDDAVTGLEPTGSIGDIVWRDEDGQGDLDLGEFGIADVIVSLTPPVGVNLGNGAGVAITTTTSITGSYLFDGLPASGDYVVTVDTGSLPGGSGTATNTYDEDSGIASPDNTTTVTLDHDATDGSDEHDTADFGYTLPTVIDGTIWHDLNQSGTSSPDTGEEYLFGVTVVLKDNGGTIIDTTTTDANGYFEFTGNYNGTYTVEVVTPYSGDMGSGTWSPTFDTDGTGTADTTSVTVATGGYAHVDYSYVQTGLLSLGDTLYYDWDGDGTQDLSEEGIPNITLSLYEDSNGDGVIDPANDALISTTVTSLTGTYSFGNLPADDYILVVAENDSDFPELALQTADPDGTIDGQGVVPLTTVTDTIDFGYQPYGYGSIGDTVFIDLDGNGLQVGPAEAGISSITVELWADLNGDGSYSLITSTVTDGSGSYLFDNLPDGDYRVIVDTNDSDLPIDTFGESYPPTTETTQAVTLNGGNSYLDADFGFAPLGAMGDTVYWDANGDGTQGWEENGIVGVVITLTNSTTITDPDGTVYVPGSYVLTDTTDSNGNYLFNGRHSRSDCWCGPNGRPGSGWGHLYRQHLPEHAGL